MVEKQAQNELKIAAARPRQLLVRLKLPDITSRASRDFKWAVNEVINETEVAVVGRKKDKAILTTSRGRRVRPPKKHGD